MTLHLSVDALRWLQFLLKSLPSAVLTAKDLTFTWSFIWALIQLRFPLPACGFMACHLQKWLGIFFVCCSSDPLLPFFVTSSLGHFWLPNVSEVLLKWPASFYASSEHSLCGWAIHTCMGASVIWLKLAPLGEVGELRWCEVKDNVAVH